MKDIVVGCGRVGSALALDLVARGHSVAVVDPDAKTFARLGRERKLRRVEGVGFDKATLVRAGIERADALAAVTASDDVNLLVARLARDFFHVPTVVARLYDPTRRTLYDHFGIETVCTTIWGAEQMVRLICNPRLDEVASLGNGEVQVVRLRIGEALVGQPVSAVVAESGVVITGLTRGTRTFIPTSTETLVAGDLIYVAVDIAARDRVLEQWTAGDKEVRR